MKYQFTCTISNKIIAKKNVASMQRKIKSITNKITSLGNSQKIASEISRLDLFAYDRYIDQVAVLVAKKDLMLLNDRFRTARNEAGRMQTLSEWSRKRKAAQIGRGRV